MKRAIIYARVSTDEQRGNFSIPTQIKACWDYAQDNGYQVVGDRFVDPDTGRDITKAKGAIPAFVDDFTSRELDRPMLTAATSYLETYGFDTLLVFALDRLARDGYIRKTIELDIEARGADIVYVQENFDDTPEGEIRKDLYSAFAKWENAKRVERSMRGKKAKAESGKFVQGKAPYGYRIDRKSHGGLAVDEIQAAIVQRIYELYTTERASIRVICKILTSESIPTHSGGSKWAKTSVSRILSSETYVGRWYYRRSQLSENGRVRTKRDKSEWIEVPVTPIIERGVFQLAQERKRLNKERVRRNPARFYLLGGMVVCGRCGRAYGSQTRKAGPQRRKTDAPFYRHRAREGDCRNHSVSARRLNPVVWSGIREMLLEPESMRRGYKNAIAEQYAGRKRSEKLIKTVRKEIMALDQKNQNLTAAYIDPDIRLLKDEYIRQRTQISESETLAKAREAKLVKELSETPTPASLESIEVFVNEIQGLFSEGFDPDDQLKRKILEMLNTEVVIMSEDEVIIKGWFEPKRTRLLSRSSRKKAPHV